MATIEPNFESICIDPNDDLVLYEKEIVRSRIEKFLYAICSLDTDDLPTPLSRIEEMYKCLVMGVDFITFTPLSRAEKFVMAMLGAYDVELLPTPISRSETLMKKIATGDNNLDDVDNLQSRYEFLLAYIIKAGGFNGGSGDFYYQLTSLTSGFTTIYDTFDMPVKSAILTGQTLVNLALYKDIICVENTQNALTETILKGNTQYILMFTHNGDGERFVAQEYVSNAGWIRNHNIQLLSSTPYQYYIFTTSETCGLLKIQNITTNTYTLDNLMLIEYQEGMEHWDIPYFTGMSSVRMPVLTTYGKNLFDVSRHGSLTPQPTGDIQLNSAEWGKYDVKYILKPNTQYTLTILGDGTKCWIAIFVDGSSQSSNVETSYTKTFSTNSNGEVTIGIYANSDKYVGYSRKSISIEEGTVSTPYEPYKSTTVTIDSDVLLTTEKDHFIVTENGSQIVLYNEEVILRSNGDVYDELNLLTGKLTQRISENNEVLSEEVHRTVDLSTVDQDGKETELSTFDDITHVIVSSEELIPEGEITVATKNATDMISIMSLRMDDISNSQSTLEESANAQSDDIDVTMLGVTDIYEQLL